jgi:superoxide reductase
MNLFICKHCGNMSELLYNSGVPVVCCGEDMAEIVPNTVEASVEKHLPSVTVTGENVNIQVGSTIHPMESEHNIVFVYVETKTGGQRKMFKPGDEPKAEFIFKGEKPVAAYAYCNLHGLWKTEIK